jgi:membrane-associated phospholipid phosphatase
VVPGDRTPERTACALTALLVGYNLLVAGVWASLWTESDLALWCSAGHAATAVIVLLIARRARVSLPRISLLDLLPLFLLPVFWIELELLFLELHDSTLDDAIAAVDRWAFGANLHAVWWPSMPALHGVMEALYAAYLPALLAFLVFLAVRCPPSAFREAVLRATVTYLCCDVIYLVLPVFGPRATEIGLEANRSVALSGVFKTLNDTLRQWGDSPGTAFPSSHVAGILTAAIAARTLCSRRVGNAMLGVSVGVAASTVYTQNHYFLDAVAGAALALLLQYALVPALLGRAATGPTGQKAEAPTVSARPPLEQIRR